MLSILGKLDNNFGEINGIYFEYPKQIVDRFDVIIHFCTRMTNAMTMLFSDTKFQISNTGANKFLTLQRWINMIFASSPYANSGHILATYNKNPAPNSLWSNMQLNPSDFNKFAIMYLPESNIKLSLDGFWKANKNLCASLCFALQSPRFIGTEQAFSKRATICNGSQPS